MAVTLNASTTTGLVQSADTSGIIELQSNGTTKATVSSSGLAIGQYNPSASLVTSGTAVASTSGTSIDFTSIPTWVKRVTVMFNGVSTNGTSDTIIQIGSGSVETSGYVGSACSVNGVQTGFSTNMSAGFLLAYDQSAATVRSGAAVLTLVGSNIWTFTSMIGRTDAAGNGWAGGSKSASGTIDRVRITNTNGTDTFDAGSINILYE